jgi:hypothetical protein
VEQGREEEGEGEGGTDADAEEKKEQRKGKSGREAERFSNALRVRKNQPTRKAERRMGH